MTLSLFNLILELFLNNGVAIVILAVKAELGMTDKREAGLGMAPVCWLD